MGLTTNRVRLLLSKGHSCYRPRKKGATGIPGLTDVTIPRRLGPKRANNIRKLFNLSKEDDVRQYVLKRPMAAKEGKENAKPRFKSPKIQRLITPIRLQRKRHRAALKKRRVEKRNVEAAEYARLLAQRSKESTEKKKEARRRRSSMRDSLTSQDSKKK